MQNNKKRIGKVSSYSKVDLYYMLVFLVLFKHDFEKNDGWMWVFIALFEMSP
jgi:hypothetical protein